MSKRFVRSLFAMAGGLVGLSFISVTAQSEFLTELVGSGEWPLWAHTLVLIIGMLSFALIFFYVSGRFYTRMQDTMKSLEQSLNELQMADIIFCCVGLVIGLVIAFFLTYIFKDYLLAPLAMTLSILLYMFFGYMGARLFLKRWRELPFFTDMKRGNRNMTDRIGANQAEKQGKADFGEEFEGEEEQAAQVKLLDSSVLIDGRIVDIYKSGFLEGKLIVPQFILEELQKIADSSDDLKRRRGRRGLAVVSELRGIDGIDISVGGYEMDTGDEVDMKLLKLTKQLDGKIMTNDYNLNRVSELSGVHVLNLNELSNALKPALISGEEMSVLVTKEGKEQNQGVGYLDDGTMIVIENGKSLIGEKAVVVVTSVLQTAAGRMIFAKPREQAS